MTYAQKMMDEHRIGYMDGREEGVKDFCCCLESGSRFRCYCGTFPNVFGAGHGYPWSEMSSYHQGGSFASEEPP